MRRIYLPPEGRDRWPEPLGLVGLAALMRAKPALGSGFAALVLLVGAAYVAYEYRFPSR